MPESREQLMIGGEPEVLAEKLKLLEEEAAAAEEQKKLPKTKVVQVQGAPEAPSTSIVIALGPTARDRDPPRLVPHAFDAHVDRPRRQQRPGFLGPLDDRDTVAVDHLFEPEVCELGHGGRAVGVDVMDW